MTAAHTAPSNTAAARAPARLRRILARGGRRATWGRAA
jgi:hypothetical protein